MGLTAEQITALLGKTRTKGDYVVKLNSFLESGEQGISVNETWVELKDKKATTLKQGFENAKGNKEAHADSEFVKVISSDDQVFLVNLKAAGDDGETAEEGGADQAFAPETVTA
jgi:hypothetical protein